MKTRRVTRYYAECGRGFWNKVACLSHEKVCKCFSNPSRRACQTCLHRIVTEDYDEAGRWTEYWCEQVNDEAKRFDCEKWDLTK